MEMPEGFRVSEAALFPRGCLGSRGWLQSRWGERLGGAAPDHNAVLTIDWPEAGYREETTSEVYPG